MTINEYFEKNVWVEREYELKTDEEVKKVHLKINQPKKNYRLH